jgi:hypothetical protein
MCFNEKSRLEKVACEHPPESARDVRLEYIGHYLIQCRAPQCVIEWTILKKLVEDTKLQEERYALIDLIHCYCCYYNKYIVFTRFLSVKRRALEHLNKPDPDKADEFKVLWFVVVVVNYDLYRSELLTK